MWSLGQVRPVRKAISFLTKEREMVYCGQQASLGSIIIQKTDVQHRRNGADRNWGSMSLTYSDFDAACKAITGGEFPEETLKVVVRPDHELISRLLKLHETVGDIAENDARHSCVVRDISCVGTAADPPDDQVSDRH